MLEFITGSPPKGFKTDFESFLFNTRPHRLTQSKTGWLEFHLLERSQKKIFASVAFHIQKKKASSPCRAPFGSFEISEKLKSTDLIEFIRQVEKELKESGITQIEIVNPPALYTEYHNRIVAVMLSLSYTPTHCDISCSIPVNKKPLVNRMNKGKRKQYRHSLQFEFKFKKIPLTKLNEVYRFIESCRQERGQNLSLSWKEIQTIVTALPKVFLLFTVEMDKKIIASTIGIRVSPSILYTFYSAHKKEFDHLNPMVFLLSQIYDWCHQNKINLLDMGTSTVMGQTNFSLLDFKLRVGGTLSPKFTFHKHISQ